MLKTLEKRKQQLGINAGTACGQLRKKVLFHLLKQLNQNICFQCNKEIHEEKELSIEHKIPYLDSENPKELFFDLNNIAFSHLSCNSGVRRNKPSQHGLYATYGKGCRCEKCTEANKLRKRQQRLKIAPIA